MRIKYYIRGICIGIIFATLVLTISFYFGKGSFAKEKLSDEEIIERATELGMVMEATTEEGTEEGTEENTEEDSEAVAEESDENNTEKEATVTAEAAPQIEDVATPDSEEAETITYVPFTVRGGESSEIVSKNLKKAGLIDSVDDFNKYLSKIKVDNLIQSGTFYVKQGSSYDDIAALLVNKDSRTTTPPKQN